MRLKSVRRSVALAGAAVMAGATLTAVGAGVASAAPIRAEGEYGGAFASSFRIIRDVSDATPMVGDTISISTTFQRASWGDLIYGMRSDTPACLERVPGTRSAQASGGGLINDGDDRWDSSTDTRLNLDGLPGVGPDAWIRADYKVLCDAGSLATGGAEFASVAEQYRGSMSLGPTITVQRIPTTTFLHVPNPASPAVGQETTLRAVVSNPPVHAERPTPANDGVVKFLVDGVEVGQGALVNGEAEYRYTPTSAGSKNVTAVYQQSSQHATSTSQSRPMTVAAANVNSTTTVEVAGSPQVGSPTSITATVNPSGAGGEVRFTVNGQPIGTSTVGAGGTATIPWVPQTAGQNSIDAEFLGRTGVNPSAGQASVAVTAAPVEQTATTTALDAIPNSPTGSPITLRAAVSPAAAGGTVTFFVGDTALGTPLAVPSNGIVTTSWTPNAPGEYSVRAVYSGTDTRTASVGTQQALITPEVVDPGPGDPGDPGDPGTPEGTGSLGSLIDGLGSLGLGGGGEGDNGGGSLDFGSLFGGADGEGDNGGGSLDLGSLIGGAGGEGDNGGGSLGSDAGEINFGSLLLGSLLTGGALALAGGNN